MIESRVAMHVERSHGTQPRRPMHMPSHTLRHVPHARLHLRKAWWSEKAPRLQLTVVTGLTASRLDQLQHQCASWKGPLSASVYLVVKGDGAGGISEEGRAAMAKAEAELAEFHKRCAGAPRAQGPRGAMRRPHGPGCAACSAACRNHVMRRPLDALHAARSAWRGTGPCTQRAAPTRRVAAHAVLPHSPAWCRARSLSRRLNPPPLPDPRTEVADGCQLDASLLYEVVADDVMMMLLPINVMRNYALLQVGGRCQRPPHGAIGVGQGDQESCSSRGMALVSNSFAAVPVSQPFGMVQPSGMVVPPNPIRQARTRLVAMVDVDLLVSSTLSDWMEVKDK